MKLGTARHVSAMIVAAAVALAVASSASASFPGANGEIAFVRDSQIVTVASDGSGETNLTSKHWNRRPSWSGSGLTIAYQSCCSRGSWQIWTMRASGSGKKNVSNSRSNDTHPAFSKDGLRIAFVRTGQIWVMNADGTGQRRLTAPTGYTDDAPAWSPDGTKIAFQRCCFPISGWPPEISQVFTMDADGRNQRNVSGSLGSASDFHPDWSPDGTRIAFARYDGIRPDEIYVMEADGSGQIRLSPGTNANHPRWAPDGTRIVFELGGSWVKTLSSTGGQAATLVAGYDPAWQPLPK